MLDRIQERMDEFISSLQNPRISELFKTLPSGKRLRSKLILNIASEHEKALDLCAVVELIHLASLLHDDVIDEADTRRGKSSYNAVYGDKSAIMLGDILYSKAYAELTKIDGKIARIISNAVTSLSIGELIDVELGAKFNTDKDIYMDMIYKKTASLIEASAASGAILAGRDEEKFANYGKNLGLAFQIIDDILDITQDSKTLGKPALNDFKEGKTTLPYMYLYEALDKQEQEKLLGLFGKELSDEQISWIKQKMNETKALERSIKEARELGIEALKAIEDENLPKLNEVVKAMIDREF